MDTPCKNCCFATYEKDSQVECSSGFLNKFREKNYGILEAYDNEKEFYVIQDVKCPGFREWANPDLERLNKELHLHFDVFLMCNEQTDLHQIITTVRSLEKSETLPNCIRIVFYEKTNLLISEIMRELENSPITIQVSKSMEITTAEKTIDRQLIGDNRGFYVYAIPGYQYRTDIFSRLDKLVFDEFRNFISILGSDELRVPTIISKYAHNHIGGNKECMVSEIDSSISDKEKDYKLYSIIEKLWFLEKFEGKTLVEKASSLWTN